MTRQTLPKKLCSAAFVAILIGAILILLVRVWVGPVAGLVSVRTTLNVEAAVFLALCGWLLSTDREFTAPSPPLNRKVVWLGIAAVGLAGGLAFVHSIGFPFLFDDYRHLMFAFDESPKALFERVVIHHPTSGDLFFRPLGDFVFEWLYEWAHFDFRAWHAVGVLLHVANTLLVVLFAKRICGGWLGALAAGLLFGWHAAHVEAVSWSSALYDLLATFFVLLVLLEIVSGKTGAWRYLWLLLAGLLSCVSKESSYCLPMLGAILVAFQPRGERTLAWKKTACVSVACAWVFAYRFWYLGGLGGYQASSGGSLAASLHVLSVVQALGLRLWAILFVPVNWSVTPGLALKVAFTGLAVAVLGFARTGRLGFQRTGLLAAFTVCAALPAISLLLIGYDLAGARVLYLPSVGIALFWAELAESVANRRMAVCLCGLLVVFQLAALEHNEELWGPVAEAARWACLDAGAILRRDPKATVFAWQLPRAKNGVYFLQNAFPYCVAVNAGVDSGRVQVGVALPLAMRADEVVLRWDDASARLVVVPH